MDITTRQLKNVSISAEIVPVEQLSSAIDSLDNRLSDLYIDPITATSTDVVDMLSTIVTRFGGNN